jgi:hypothetical protein
LRRLRTELALNDTQYTVAKEVILSNQQQITRIRQQSQPEIEQLAAQANAKIEQSLTPEQSAHFKEFLVRFPQPGIRSLTSALAKTPPKTGPQN